MNVIQEAPRQKQQERESLLELLARGFVGGASQSLGTGLGNLATQGLGMLMDPNMKTMNAKALQGMGFSPEQSQSIGAVKNPQFQRDMMMNAHKQQSELAAQQQKQRQAAEYVNMLKEITGGQGSNSGPVPSTEGSELTLSDVKSLATYAQQEKKMEGANKRGAWKETKEVRNTILDSSDEAKKSLIRLARMKQIHGNVNNPATVKALETTGLEFLLNPDSQEFKKLTTDFLTGVSKMFGGRVSNYEVSRFLDRIPNLMQTKEGRDRVIKNLQAFYEADAKKGSIMREVIKQNGGTPPYDLAEQVSEKMEPIIAKLEDKFSFDESAKNEFKAGSRVAQLPDASDLAGKKIRDHETGQILVSNGSEWVPEANANKSATQAMKPADKPMTKQERFPYMVGDTNYGEY